MVLPTVVEWSHWIVCQVIRPGCIAFDATVGNGYDLLMLAQQLNGNGIVVGCDIQECAIARARERVRSAGIENIVRLHQASHEYIDHICMQEDIDELHVVMYNLGYLPGGDKSITTRPATTVASLQKAIALLAPGGVITVVCYQAHAGGKEETEEVLSWCSALATEDFDCATYSSLHSATAPLGIAIARRVTV